MEKVQGSCLCGSIQISVPTPTQVTVCHCTSCVQWSGGALFVVRVDGRKQELVTISGTTLRVYASSPWAQRAFCGNCGTHLYYQLNDSLRYSISAGLFADNADFVLVEQIFIDTKPPYYTLADNTPCLTGAQAIARAQKKQSP